jgi:PPOX class probable F420-dependent enzyme
MAHDLSGHPAPVSLILDRWMGILHHSDRTITEKEERPMSSVIPETHRDLFHKRAFARLATIMPDGTPQVTPVWYDYDGTHVRINSAEGRVKDRNMRRNPQVALAIMDPDNPYRYLALRGRVVEITTDGADAHIDLLAQKYLGREHYPYRRAGEVRVLYKIQPDHVSSMG